MKFQTIFSFELKYQLRSVATWIYFGIAFLFPIGLAIIGNPSGGTDQNAPSLLIFVTVFGGIIWLLMAGVRDMLPPGMSRPGCIPSRTRCR